MDFFVEHRRGFLRPVLLQPGVTSIAHNRQQPGASVSAVEAVKKSERAQVRLLHHVFRILVIARQPARQVVSRIQMRQYDLFKTSELDFFSQPYFLRLNRPPFYSRPKLSHWLGIFARINSLER